MTAIPTCRRCGTALGGSYTTEMVTAEHHHVQLDQEGVRMGQSLLAATSACSWNCLAVLAAIEAGADADAAVQVVAERERQVTAEGWTPEHDDSHAPGELAVAGVFYALQHGPVTYEDSVPHDIRVQGDPVTEVRWPWDAEWWKPKGPERDLVRGAALVAAEADRLVRARRATRPQW